MRVKIPHRLIKIIVMKFIVYCEFYGKKLKIGVEADNEFRADLEVRNRLRILEIKQIVHLTKYGYSTAMLRNQLWTVQSIRSGAARLYPRSSNR